MSGGKTLVKTPTTAIRKAADELLGNEHLHRQTQVRQPRFSFRPSFPWTASAGVGHALWYKATWWSFVAFPRRCAYHLMPASHWPLGTIEETVFVSIPVEVQWDGHRSLIRLSRFHLLSIETRRHENLWEIPPVPPSGWFSPAPGHSDYLKAQRSRSQ